MIVTIQFHPLGPAAWEADAQVTGVDLGCVEWLALRSPIGASRALNTFDMRPYEHAAIKEAKERISGPTLCAVCHLRKKPIGRDAAPELANSLCDPECAGYYQDPKPPSDWPGERAEQTQAVRGSAVEQPIPNRQVAGSNPAHGATETTNEENDSMATRRATAATDPPAPEAEPTKKRARTVTKWDLAKRADLRIGILRSGIERHETLAAGMRQELHKLLADLTPEVRAMLVPHEAASDDVEY